MPASLLVSQSARSEFRVGQTLRSRPPSSPLPPGPASISVKVFLLPLGPRQSFFYFQDDSDGPEALPAHDGLRGWAERRAHRVRLAIRHPKGRLAQKLRQGWDWLQRRIHPDEPLLAALPRASSIDVYHRSSLPAAEANALWLAYLRRRIRRHLPWLVFDGVLAPLSLVLALLPGPNLIGYWFAYRAVRHLLILLGIRRALFGRVETVFHPVKDLDPSGDCADERWRNRAVQQYALSGLHAFVARIAPEPDAAATATATAAAGGDGTGRAGRSDHATAELQHPQGDRRPRPALPS